MLSVTDLSAVFLCTVSPALSAVLLVALKVAENAIVGVLGGDARGNNDARTLRLRVKVVLEAVLQIASAAILVKMATLLVGELYEVVYGEAAEDSLGASDGLSYSATACVGAGIIVALILVHLAEGGGHGERTASDKKEKGSESSSRGVMLAMLIHTCAEGLAAGLVMSASKATSPSSSSSLNTREGDDELKSMLDITSSYFVSLLLHNVSEGLVVATAVKSELEEKSNILSSSSSSASWFLPTLVKTTLSHLGQPLGLLTVLFAPQLGLAGVSEMPLVVAFIQGVSFGSIAAAILLESLPEVGSSCQSVWSAFLGLHQSAEKKKMD